MIPISTLLTAVWGSRVYPVPSRVAPWLRVWGLLLCASVLHAAPAFTTSSSGRFVAVGPDSARNLAVTRWAEDSADRIESILDLKVPFNRLKPLEIRQHISRSAGARFSGNRIAGRYVLAIDGAFQPEAALAGGEELIRLILAATIEQRQRELERRPVPASIPVWLPAGLALNLSHEMTLRSRKILAFTGEDQGLTPVSETLEQTVIPEGWQGQRARCGLVMEWLLTFPGCLDKMLNRLTMGEVISPQWVARYVVGVNSVPAMEARWRLWNEREGRAVREFGGLTPEMMMQLRQTLCLTPAGLSLDRAIEARRKNPAIAPAAQEKIQQIRALTMGRAPEFVEIGEKYCRFLEGITGRSWTFTLRRRLADAEQALDRLDHLVVQRQAYVDAVEEEFGKEPVSSMSHDGMAPSTGLEKSAMESYVDEAEKKQDARPE